VVSGGYDNHAGVNSAAHYSVVSSGYLNIINGSQFSVISGGKDNFVRNSGNDRSYATVSGGNGNIADYNRTVVSGGNLNFVDGTYGVVSGGEQNYGDYKAMISGGSNNRARGAYGWLEGRNAFMEWMYTDSFVWSDATGGTCDSQGSNTFNICAQNGIYFRASNPGSDQLRYQSFDIAEFMSTPKQSGLEKAELAIVSDDRVVSRSMRAYDENLIGVVSSNRTTSFFMGESESSSKDHKRVPISLAGPVYAKVNNESGVIRIGEPITSSSVPGVGMKAVHSGKVIGYAMENEDFREADTKEMLVFLSTGYYVDSNKIKQLKEKARVLKNRLAELKK
jgi:hypothetical protein